MREVEGRVGSFVHQQHTANERALSTLCNVQYGDAMEGLRSSCNTPKNVSMYTAQNIESHHEQNAESLSRLSADSHATSSPAESHGSSSPSIL